MVRGAAVCSSPVVVLSPARIPLECWEPPTKAPFSGGKVEEELEEDTEEKGTFTHNYHSTKSR